MFDEMPHRNLATWNAYISIAVQDWRTMDAIEVFKEFLCVHGEPNSLMLCAFVNISVANVMKFCAVLNACVDLLRLNHG
ncbi:hypothetical protein MtrunA17_Chr1g0205311 [Medicago truncatula]|uniref:Pentatricopeptide repeat-containing protein n=1 Tax=Medicago truncatula TaxID=3880 RepID=A0A396JWS6_MEDTR|nr:hypothetical protein MtrunA17_Chr1g0205311 [Medicago truncatula]